MGLFSNKAPTAKFRQIGDQVVGDIVAFDKQQRTEYLKGGGIGEPMFWSGRRPVAGAAVDPQTGEANRPVMDDVLVLDTGIPDDYGQTERRLFVKGAAMLEGIAAACKEAGVRDVDLGGRLTCTWASGAGGTADPRVYAFTYVPPGGTERIVGQPQADSLQETLARKNASATAAAERLTKKPPASKATKATKAALGVVDEEPPF
jgi:hypothetical protein